MIRAATTFCARRASSGPAEGDQRLARQPFDAPRLGTLLARSLVIRVKSNEAVTATAVVIAEGSTRRRLRKLGRPYRAPLARTQLRVSAGVPASLKLRLRSAGRKALRGAAGAKLRLELTLTDSAGNSRRLKR